MPSSVALWPLRPPVLLAVIVTSVLIGEIMAAPWAAVCRFFEVMSGA